MRIELSPSELALLIQVVSLGRLSDAEFSPEEQETLKQVAGKLAQELKGLEVSNAGTKGNDGRGTASVC